MFCALLYFVSTFCFPIFFCFHSDLFFRAVVFLGFRHPSFLFQHLVSVWSKLVSPVIWQFVPIGVRCTGVPKLQYNHLTDPSFQRILGIVSTSRTYSHRLCKFCLLSHRQLLHFSPFCRPFICACIFHTLFRHKTGNILVWFLICLSSNLCRILICFGPRQAPSDGKFARWCQNRESACRLWSHIFLFYSRQAKQAPLLRKVKAKLPRCSDMVVCGHFQPMILPLSWLYLHVFFEVPCFFLLRWNSQFLGSWGQILRLHLCFGDFSQNPYRSESRLWMIFYFSAIILILILLCWPYSSSLSFCRSLTISIMKMYLLRFDCVSDFWSLILCLCQPNLRPLDF